MNKQLPYSYRCLSISLLTFGLFGCGGAEQAAELISKTPSTEVSISPSPTPSQNPVPTIAPKPTPSPMVSPPAAASPAPVPTKAPLPTQTPTSTPSPKATGQPINMFFSGKDLKGWRAAVQVNEYGLTGSDIWSVTEQGEVFAYSNQRVFSGLYTERDDYRNYELNFEYMYSQEQRVHDSGIGIHGQGAFILSDGAFPASTQVQLRSGYEGDLLLRDMYIYAEDGCATGADNGNSMGRIIQREQAKLNPNQWNRVKIVSAVTTDQDSIIKVWINDKLINKGIRASHESGRIVLQYEGSAIKFRELTLKDIQPDEYNTDTSCMATPSPQPTSLPTAVPTTMPTAIPSIVPTVAPTAVPTMAPTVTPTAMPTVVPTVAPTAVPTPMPTAVPTVAPTAKPTATPTAMPTAMPTSLPTASPNIDLFNGKDFSGFGFSIQRRNNGFRAEDFWSVTDNGEIFADGNQRNLKWRTPQSGLYTESLAYGNYELVFEYMYTESNRSDGNSGVWIHGGRDFVDSDRAFPASVEMQLRKGYEGDLLLKQLNVEAEPGFKTSDDQNTKNGRIHRRADPKAHSWGQWNKVKIVTRETRDQGNVIEVWINGVYVNKGIRVGRSHGRITFQAEGSDIMFRNIQLKDLEK